MRESKALAIQALLLTGAVVRIEIRKAGQSDPDMWWLGHLDSIAELLLPSVEAGQPSPAGEGAQETPLFWRHAIQECNEAHEALDRLGAPKTRTVARIRGEGYQEITIGLRDRIRSIPRPTPSLPPERAALVERLTYVADYLKGQTWSELIQRYGRIVEEAAAALRGETGDGK